MVRAEEPQCSLCGAHCAGSGAHPTCETTASMVTEGGPEKYSVRVLFNQPHGNTPKSWQEGPLATHFELLVNNSGLDLPKGVFCDKCFEEHPITKDIRHMIEDEFFKQYHFHKDHKIPALVVIRVF